MRGIQAIGLHQRGRRTGLAKNITAIDHLHRSGDTARQHAGYQLAQSACGIVL